MIRFLKKSTFYFIILALFLIYPGESSAQEDSNTVIYIEQTALQTAQEVMEYWTEERMREAKPIDLPMIPMSDEQLLQSMVLAPSLPDDAEPGFALGWDPASSLPQTDPLERFSLVDLEEWGFITSMNEASPQILGEAPTNPLSGPYGPFQRWTWLGAYLQQNTQTIGRLFFTTPSGNSSCSASVIGRRTIATASHCLHSGAGGSFYGNWLFCPSYRRGSGGSGEVNPERGCWSWSHASISTGWLSSDVDRDYACIVTATTGTLINNNVGNVTGWTGRAWNFPSQLPVVSLGYPAGAPFAGYHIVMATGPEWYEVNMSAADPQVSKYMGNDMTGGSSGGPWWQNMAHRQYEYPDTDGSWDTNPFQGASSPYLNGVNSHKRCRVDCRVPPIASAGLFWQEMGSPQFRNTDGDEDESEDIFEWCFSME